MNFFLNLKGVILIQENSLENVCKLLVILLTHKHQNTHGCIVNTVATDALVLKHQAISIHNAD